jgi:hypothetical protein
MWNLWDLRCVGGADVWIERPTEKTEKLEFVFGVKGEQKIYKGYSEVDAQCRT